MTIPFTVYDCTRPKPLKTYSKKIDSNCSTTLIKTDILTDIESTVVQIPFHYNIPAEILTVKIKTESIYCTVMRNNVQKLKKTNYLGFRDMLLRPARAKHAINTGRLKFDFVEATLKKGTTQIVLDSNDIDDDGFCKYRKDTIKLNIYQISYRESEVTVEITPNGEIFGFKLYDEEINIEQQNFGYLNDGTFVQFNARDLRDCPMEILHSGVMGKYSQGGKNFIIDSESGFSFELTDRKQLCNLGVTQTNDKRIYILSGIHPPTNTTLYAPSDASWRTFILSAAQFVSVQSTRKLNMLRHAFIKAECILFDKLTGALVHAASMNPSEIAHELTGVRGTTVAIAGAAIHILQCEAKEAVLRPAENCTTEIPIKLLDTNTSAFMNAETHVVLKSSTLISCNDMSVPLFKIRGRWYKMSPNLIEMEKISKFLPKKVRIEDFNVTTITGLYRHELTDKFEPTNDLHYIRHQDKANIHITEDGRNIIETDDMKYRKSTGISRILDGTSIFDISLDSIALGWCSLITLYLIYKKWEATNATNPDIQVNIQPGAAGTAS